MGLLDNIRELNSGSRFASARPMAPATPVNNSLAGLPFNNPPAPQGMSADDKSALALGLASGFAGMSGNPNAGNIMQGIGRQQDALALRRKETTALDLASKQRNATAAYLRKSGREDLATAIETKAITAAQALAMFKPKDPSAAIQSYQFYAAQVKKSDPNAVPKSFEQYQTDLKTAGVAQPASVGETSWQKAAGTAQVGMFVDNIEASKQSRKTIMNTSLLNELGKAMDSGVMPVALRKLVPEGLSGPIDAYNAILKSTALSLKGKGTGPMTDKDFDNLLATAGSISASPEARRIVQMALAENARISLKIADISSQAISGSLDRLEAVKQINELMQSEPLTDEMRKQLSTLTGGETQSSLGDIDAANADLAAAQARIAALKAKQNSPD